MDFVAVLRASLAPFIAWTAAVLFVTFVGRQPGVACVTPVAWVMACWVGLSCVDGSRSERKSALLAEAALAGAIYGLLAGLLFIFIAPYMGEVKPEERQKMLVLCAGMIAVGTFVCALLSMAVGAARANRRAAK